MREESFHIPAEIKTEVYRAESKGGDAFITTALEFGNSAHRQGGIYLRQHSISLRVAQEGAVVYGSILKLTPGMNRI